MIGQERSEFGWDVPTFVDHNEVLKSVLLMCSREYMPIVTISRQHTMYMY